MQTAYCDIDLYQEAPPSLAFNEKLSLATALAVSLAFSGTLASAAVYLIMNVQA